jgi:K+-transporting ATPase ATPase C chain
LKDGILIGSELIAQQFESNKYFQSRPSYNCYSSMPSGGSNLAIAGKDYKLKSDSLCNAFRQRNNLLANTEVPSEMMSYSASGLDPHISKQSALLQAERIFVARNFSEDKRRALLALIDKLTENPQIGILGEERINVLLINLEIDKL